MSTEPVYLPVTDTIKAAWDKVSGSKATMWAILVLIFIVRACLAGLDALSKNDVEISLALSVIAVVVGIVLSIVALVLNWSLMYLGLRRALEMPIEFNQIKFVFSWKIFFRMIGMTILQFVILIPVAIILFIPSAFADPETNALVGAVCYIIGGIVGVVLMLRMGLASGFVLMGDITAWQSIKNSFQVTKGNVWRLLGLAIINCIILIVSAIPLGIGLIWTIPYAVINYGEVYKKLAADHKTV